MKVVIKRNSDKASMQKLLGTLTTECKFDAQKFCGTLNLKRPPLEIQKKMRDEWQWSID